MRWATTFGASRVNNSGLYQEGVELGRFLVQKGYAVKCGGYQGLMEAVSKGVKEVGGVVVGIGLEAFEPLRENNPYLTKKIIAKDLFERLRLLVKDSELFIVQQGSIGTLNELFLVWALKYSLKETFRVCLIGEKYLSFKNCDFIPKDTLKFLELYKTLEDFKGSLT
ncbi:LOG family protein [Hippea maritima]|uniref:LOG family protein n=1 Tax=Hippea maritima (strain ATCC 700847 / DSM 10411 / MH2) TaxID=760142 RepID=F2LVP4_HIPMA|nr:LOG family protein [Hippea maritima]AEA33828.1 Conserved hypothetical protein CHP00730 [Hippea maritima DSM 10411]